MANLQTGPLLGFIHGLASKSNEGQATDRELLHRFAIGRDEAAFAALVHRHGSMVLHVAQRVLHQRQDAEDVFQAAFLVLARKAERLVWRDSIANWLYEVAYRLACEARTAACRRQVKENKAAAKPATDPLAEISLREALIALDEELIRLPARLRMPMVLCCLEGQPKRKRHRSLAGRWQRSSAARSRAGTVACQVGWSRPDFGGDPGCPGNLARHGQFGADSSHRLDGTGRPGVLNGPLTF